jgi:hypothetical protein
MAQGSFGRRHDFDGPAAGAITTVRASTELYSRERYDGRPAFLSKAPKFSMADDDFLEWKRARKPNFHTLWRPLLLMATLCFGVASLVLPDSVNDAVDWLLYAMTGLSFYSWICSRRRRQPAR